MPSLFDTYKELAKKKIGQALRITNNYNPVNVGMQVGKTLSSQIPSRPIQTQGFNVAPQVPQFKTNLTRPIVSTPVMNNKDMFKRDITQAGVGVERFGKSFANNPVTGKFGVGSILNPMSFASTKLIGGSIEDKGKTLQDIGRGNVNKEFWKQTPNALKDPMGFLSSPQFRVATDISDVVPFGMIGSVGAKGVKGVAKGVGKIDDVIKGIKGINNTVDIANKVDNLQDFATEIGKLENSKEIINKLTENGIKFEDFYTTLKNKGVGKVDNTLEALKQEARKYKSAEEFVKGRYDATPISNSPEMISWATKLQKDIQGLDRTKFLESLPKDKTGKFTINVENKITELLNNFNKNYGTNLTRQDFIEQNLPNRNDLLLDKTKSQLTDIYNQAKVTKDSRPPHQAQLEKAFNSGNKQEVNKILDSIPTNDPYKQPMESLFRDKSITKGQVVKPVTPNLLNDYKTVASKGELVPYEGLKSDKIINGFQITNPTKPLTRGVLKKQSLKIAKQELNTIKEAQQFRTKDELSNDLIGNLNNIEKVVYGSATPTADTFVKGTKTGVGKLSNKLRDVQELSSKTVGLMSQSNNMVIRNLGRLMQGFSGGLGKTQTDIVRKSQFAGGVDYAQKLASDTQRYVAGLVGEDKQALERIWTVLDPELAGKTIKEADLTVPEQGALKILRQVSEFINDTNYKNGFISEELWNKNRGGKYITRAYEPIDFPPEVADFLQQRNDKFDLNPFFRREDIDDWKQANAIKDPAYLMAKRLQQTLFNNEVKNMSESLLKTNYVSDIPKAGFVQLSDHKSYGQLAGKYVRKDILEDMRGFFYANDTAQKAFDLLNWWDRNPVRRTYKQIFTVFNPVARLGNKTSNYVFAHLGGINPITFNKNIRVANQMIKTNDPLYRRAIKDGLLGTDNTKADITKFAEQIMSTVKDKGVISKIKGVLGDLQKGYGESDDRAKLSALKTWLDRGYTYEEASRRVTNNFQNYRFTGFLYDLGAKVPVLGNPFVRFKGDLLRILKNSVIDHPFRTGATLLTWQLFTDAMSRASGETPEDKKTRENRVGSPRIPFTNTSLAIQTKYGEINTARLLGVMAYNPVGGGDLRGDIGDYAPFESLDKRNIGSDPVIGPVINTVIDSDFRGKSISDPDRNTYTGLSDLTPTEQNINKLKYLQRSYTPTIVNSAVDVVDSLRGKPNFYGKNINPTQAILRTYPGIKIENYGAKEAQEAREKDLYFQNKAKGTIESQIKSVSKDLMQGLIDEKTAEKRIENLQNKLTEEKKTGLINVGKVFNPDNTVNASDEIISTEPLPSDMESLKVAYKNADSYVNKYKEKVADVQTDPTLSDYEKKFKIVDIDYNYKAYKKQLDEIEKQYPDEIYKMDLESYGSGGSFDVKERAKWAVDTLTKTKNNKNTAQTKVDDIYVKTGEERGIPFPDYKRSAPGQILRADLDLEGKGNANIVFHFKDATGKISNIPQTTEQLVGDKQFYGLEMEIPQNTSVGTGEVWVTINGKEITSTRRPYEIVNAEPVNRYASGSNQEEFAKNQAQIDKLRNLTFETESVSAPTNSREKLQQTINEMWESGVLTTGKKGTAQAIKDIYGIDVYSYTGDDTDIADSVKKASSIKKTKKVTRVFSKIKAVKRVTLKKSGNVKFVTKKPKKSSRTVVNRVNELKIPKMVVKRVV